MYRQGRTTIRGRSASSDTSRRFAQTTMGVTHRSAVEDTSARVAVCSCCRNPQALTYAVDIRLNDSLTGIFDRPLRGPPEEPRDPTGHTARVLDQRLDHRRLAEGGGFTQRQQLAISHNKSAERI